MKKRLKLLISNLGIILDSLATPFIFCLLYLAFGMAIWSYDNNSLLFPIEDKTLMEHINNHDEIVFSYPVQYSAVPKYVKDFIHNNSEIWKNKKIFVIATMALFSVDGAGVLGRLLKQYGAKVTGGLHLQMPDSIADGKVLKRSAEKNACPKQAITLLGKTVIEQTSIEKYIQN